MPSSIHFYKNPQFLICVDQASQKQKLTAETDILVTFQAAVENTPVKLFLCHANKGNSRVSVINDTTVVDIAHK